MRGRFQCAVLADRDAVVYVPRDTEGDIYDNVFGVAREGQDWVLTHLPTGFLVALFRARSHARRCAEFLLTAGADTWRFGSFGEPAAFDSLRRVAPWRDVAVRAGIQWGDPDAVEAARATLQKYLDQEVAP